MPGRMMLRAAMIQAEADGEASGFAAIVTSAAQYDMSDIRSIKMDSFVVQCIK